MPTDCANPKKIIIDGTSVCKFEINAAKKKPERFVVPSWFKNYFRPDEEALSYWKYQLLLAKQGREYKLPDDRMRMPASELHQLLAKSFFDEIVDSEYNNFLTILDVGCSDGYMVDYFGKHGKKAVGVDEIVYPTDSLFIEEHNLAIHEMDMHCLDFDEEAFDAVWCRHTLEHSFAPLQILAEINKVLKKDGYLFIVLPPPPSPPSPYHGHWHQIPDYQLKYLLEMSGFEVLRMETVFFSYKSENDNLEIRAICKKT